MRLIRRVVSGLARRIDRYRPAPFRSALTLSNAQFLGTFDLPEVRSALRDGDEALARGALLEHFRRRFATDWLQAPRYLTDLRVDLTQISEPELLALADRVLEFELSPSGIKPRTRDGRILWRENVADSREWLWMLNRHAWWVVLGRAYAATGDDKYADAFTAQLRDWIAANPVIRHKDEASPTWRLMETGLRMRLSWIPCFRLFFDAASFDDDAKLLMLKCVHDHASFLLAHKTSENHLLRESNGLAAVAIYFNEFAQADTWLTTAMDRLTAELSTQIHADGMQIENSTGYQWLVVDEFQTTFELLLASNRGDERARISQTLERMYDVLVHLSRPNGTFPQLNDGFILWDISRLEHAGTLLNRPDFVYVGSQGKRGEPPGDLMRTFESSGIVSMRSGWDAAAHHLLFDSGPFGGHHGHEDKLSIELSCHGKPILVDAGSYTYEATDPFRAFFVGSHSHNTVTVDGLSQLRRCNRDLREAAVHNTEGAWFLSHERVVLASGSYRDGYDRLEMRNLPASPRVTDVAHRRTVLFVNREYWIVVDGLFGATPHRYEWLYHCDPAVTVDPTPAGDHLLRRDDMQAAVLLAFRGSDTATGSILRGSEDPIQGWFSRDHYFKEPSATLCIAQDVAAHTSAATAVVPVLEATADVRIHYGASEDGLTHSIEVAMDGRTDAIEFGYVENSDVTAPDRRVAWIRGTRSNPTGTPDVLCDWS